MMMGDISRGARTNEYTSFETRSALSVQSALSNALGTVSSAS